MIYLKMPDGREYDVLQTTSESIEVYDYADNCYYSIYGSISRKAQSLEIKSDDNWA